MKIQFVGSGSAFNKIDGQSNLIVKSDSGKNLLIDCGTYCWSFMEKLIYKTTDFDSVYISHLHADHIGGLEEIAFTTYFNPTVERPKLYCNDSLMPELWKALEGGLGSIQGKVVTLTEYFDCKPVEASGKFEWEGIEFIPVQTVHVMSGYHIKHSYGLMITSEAGIKVFFTSDTQFCPNQIQDFYDQADYILQDSETSPFKSGVHAHYDDLKTLSDETKSKMWLYHYQPDTDKEVAVSDGFRGFVNKEDEFDF